MQYANGSKLRLQSQLCRVIAIMETIYQAPGITSADVFDIITPTLPEKIHRRTLLRDLDALVSMGVLRFELSKSPRPGLKPRKRYFLDTPETLVQRIRAFQNNKRKESCNE